LALVLFLPPAAFGAGSFLPPAAFGAGCFCLQLPLALVFPHPTAFGAEDKAEAMGGQSDFDSPLFEGNRNGQGYNALSHHTIVI